MAILDDLQLSRREVMATGVAVGVAAAPGMASAAPAGQPTLMKVSFTVNGQRQALELDTRTTLLDALREHLKLTGSKKGCNQGACGACTILVNGERILSCLALAVQYDGQEITTIEGLGSADDLHPIQRAFVQHDGFQCGYCTPGQICSAVGMIAELQRGVPSHVTGDLTARPLLSADELRERLSGNLCRCGAYANIIDAVSEVAGLPLPAAGERRSA